MLYRLKNIIKLLYVNKNNPHITSKIKLSLISHFKNGKGILHHSNTMLWC